MLKKRRDRVSAPLIEIKDLRKVYRVGDQKVVALNRISLDIEQGEICCLLGTSGSGKSTLLNMMAGLEKPTSGSIRIDDVQIEQLNERKLADFRQLNVGFVFQSYNLLPTMSALDNVAMPLLFSGKDKKTRNKAARDMLSNVGLGDRVNHKPPEMSGGQQQRVGIARAYVALPRIVFADEPTGNLDSKTTLEVMAIILNLAKQHNQTLIIVSHDPSIARYAHKIVHILDGNINKIEINENPTEPIVYDATQPVKDEKHNKKSKKENGKEEIPIVQKDESNQENTQENPKVSNEEQIASSEVV